MKNPLSLLPILILECIVLGGFAAGIYIWNNRKGEPMINLIKTSAAILGIYFILRLAGIRWIGEEGDYLAITAFSTIYGLNIFQLLRINNKQLGRLSFVIMSIPLFLVIPLLLFLIVGELRWIIPYLLKY